MRQITFLLAKNLSKSLLQSKRVNNIMNLHILRNTAFSFCLIICISSTANSADYKTVKEQAEQGNAAAQFDLGTLYDLGEGVQKSLTEAAKWYHKAAEQGEVAAQYNLAIMYDTGEGVEKNIVSAYAWLSAAEVFGYKGARESSKDFRKRMTPAQIEKGDEAVITIVNRITENKNQTE